MLSGKEIRILSLLLMDTVFFFIEVIVGYSVKSLALVADSFHMLNDIISLVILLWAVRVAKSRQLDSKYTYGWQRAEILGLLINAVFLLALCFTIFIELIQRFINPEKISNPKLILVVGFCGLLSNFVGLVLFHEHGGHSHSHGGIEEAGGHSHLSLTYTHSGHTHTSLQDYGSTSGQQQQMDFEEGNIEDILPEAVVSRIESENQRLLHSHTHHQHVHEEDDEDEAKNKASHKSLNMQGVFLHVLGDALGNVGVIATALFIWKTDYSWRFYFDPLVSLLITLIIFSSLLPLCKLSSKILLQLTPANLPYDRVKREILSIPAVLSLHDFHIWNLTERVFIASLHLEIDGNPEEFLDIAKEIKRVLHEYGVHNATIQPEFKRFYQKRNSSTDMIFLLKQSASNSQDPTGAPSTDPQTLEAFDKSCIIDSLIGCDTDNCL